MDGCHLKLQILLSACLAICQSLSIHSFKRNAKAFSLNAIVDVRLRRHEMIFFLNISETIRMSDFKIYHKVALDGLYISTGNDITNYFRSEANRTNV